MEYKVGEGIRQISPVTSEERIPAFFMRNRDSRSQ